MIKNKKYNSLKVSALFIFILIIDLTFLYFIKYQNQLISLSAFNLFKTGNILNLFFYLVLITGLLIILFNKSQQFEAKYFVVFFIINQILIVLIFIVINLPLPFDDFYYLNQNGNKLFIGLLFTLFQFTFFSMMFCVWLNILKVKNLLLVRSLLNSGWLMLLLLVASFVYIVSKEVSFDESEITSKNNSGVVLGAAVWSKNKPSPTLAARVDKAVHLLKQNKISSVYLTGANAPGELAESEVAFNYLKTKLNDVSNIHKETETSSTNEQIQFIKSKLLLSGKEKNVVVISDSYHLVRIMEISQFHNIEINAVPSDLPLSFEKALYFKTREALALVVFWFFAY